MILMYRYVSPMWTLYICYGSLTIPKEYLRGEVTKVTEIENEA